VPRSATVASRHPQDRFDASPGSPAADPGTFRELAEHSRDVVWVRDALDAALTYVNAAYERIWGPTGQSRRATNAETIDRAASNGGAFVMPAGRFTILSVADTGTGMDAHTRAHISEPFFTTKDTGKGSGLGLATVYGTVKQLGGYIEVESGVGDGTCFTISLPCTDQPAEPAARRPDPVAATPGQGETVLLVEDDDVVRAFTGHALRCAGYRVLDAASPESALGLVNKFADPIDLVLTDVIMPGMNGKQMVTRLERTCPDAKVLYMSGYSGTTYFDPSIVDPARERLLEKPFTRDALLHAMRDVLNGAPLVSPAHGPA